MTFETKYNCGDCDHAFYKVTDHDPRKTKGRRPSCPQCRKHKKTEATIYTKVRGDYKLKTEEQKQAVMQDIIESKKAPAGGGSNFTKAMDTTAEIVMQDYGMTNLQDNLRAGDSMAPKLEHRLEQKVEGVFKPQKPLAGMPQNNNLNKTLMKQINSGMFKAYGGANDVVAQQQASGIKKPVNIMYDYDNRK